MNGIARRQIITFGVLLLVPLATPLAAGEAQAPARGPLARALQPFVDDRLITGAVGLVANRNRVLDVVAVGCASVSTKDPMREDNLFWLASITKVFTATALMTLVDEGKVNVDDPVEKYLPEFKGQQVAGEDGKRHRPKHPVTIKQLLTHTSGIIGPNDPPIQRNNVLKDDAEQYGAASLKWEPGTRYEYNNSGINTVGRIIEVVSGTPYGDFVKQRFLTPLGMTDTTFWPDENQAARLALTSQFNRQNASLEDLPSKPDPAWLNQPKNGPHVPLVMRTYLGDALRAYPNRYAWPAGGLFSTAGDLAKFGRMMLRGGVSDGKRYVSAAAFQRMTTLQTGDLPTSPRPWIGLGWFLKGHDDGPAAGSFGHHGARGPVMWIDPRHQLVMILLFESMDLHRRGQPPGDAKNKLDAAFFHAAVENYGKTDGQR